MGKDWDNDTELAQFKIAAHEMLRVIKPGGHVLCWALPRTSHRTATALEDAGWEIRDVVTHLFGTGFPKGLDISKAIDKHLGAEREVLGTFQRNTPEARPTIGPTGHSGQEKITRPATWIAECWDGWNTALKPAAEYWILARKPLSEPTVAANVLKWHTGGINVGSCRIETKANSFQDNRQVKTNDVYGKFKPADYDGSKGRYPANVVLSGEAIDELDRQSGTSKSTNKVRHNKARPVTAAKGREYDPDSFGHSDEGGASRFFYCPKASSKERNKGCEGLPLGEPPASARSKAAPGREAPLGKPRPNSHPTVKATTLMEWLIRLVTPPMGVILDPYAGSGSTGVAAVENGFRFLGIEREPEYVRIAEERLMDAEESAAA